MIYTRFAIVGPDGLIRRVGQSEQAMVGMQAVEVDDQIIAHTDEPAFGVIDYEVPEGVDDESHYWNGTALVALPARPSQPHYWNAATEQWVVMGEAPNQFCIFDQVTGAWEDTRSVEQVAAQLHSARLAAFLPTPQLLFRFALAGAYPMSEVSEYDFPPTLEEFLSGPGFSPEQHDLIKAGLKTQPLIGRAETRIEGPIHPDDPGDGLPYFTPWLQAAKGITITSNQLDAMFNVAVPPPLYQPA